MQTPSSSRALRRWVAGGTGALALFAVTLPAFSDTAATLDVCATGCTYSTIQAAVTAAAPGDIVSVAAGTYNEKVVIGKALTLRGAGAGQSIIQGMEAGPGSGTVQITYGTSNVTVEGFTIIGFDIAYQNSEAAAMYFGGGGANAAVDNITIRNNRIEAKGEAALLTEEGGVAYTNFTITDNTLTGKTYTVGQPEDWHARMGIYFGNGATTTGYLTSSASGMTFSNNNVSFDTDYANAVRLHVVNSSITGNTFANTHGWYTDFQNINPGVTVTGNTFSTAGLTLGAPLARIQNQSYSLSDFVANNTIDRMAYFDVAGGAAPGFIYSNLADAVAAAPAGSVVHFKGTHVLTSALVLNKSITLEGDGSATTTIDTRAATGYNIRTTTNDITLRGFTLLPSTTQGYGIKVEGATTTTKTTGITIEDVTVTGSKNTGIDLNGIDGATLTDVTVTGAQAGRGIAFTDVDNATLTNITTSGNAWGGIAVGTYGRYAPLGSANVSIVSQTSSEPNALDFDLSNYADVTNPSIPTGFSGPAGYDNFTVKRPRNGNFTLWSLTPSEATAKALAQATPGSTIVRADGSTLLLPGLDLYVSSTTAVPAAGEEFVTPNGAWSDQGEGADDWTYTGQSATFHVVPSFPAGFGGMSSMDLVFAYDPAVMTYGSATFNSAWGFSSCQNGVPAAGRITCSVSTTNPSQEVLTAMTGAALSLSFTVAAPGYSVLDVIGADVRKLDGAGGYDGVAVTTHGGGLRNYLGDVVARTGASTTDATRGDGKVDFDDLQVFTQSYWAGVAGYTGTAVYRDKADVGPTTGARARTVYGVPALDRKIDFEDLVIFAASYGLSGRNVYPEAREGATDAADLEVQVVAGASYVSGDLVAVPVELSSVRDLRAGTFTVDLGPGAQLVGARFRGALAGERDGLAMARMERGLARIDAAVLGGDGLAGSGAVVEVLVRASAPVAARVTAADLRSVSGETIASNVLRATDVNSLPTATELALEAVYPNPARGRATVRVAVPAAQTVDVAIYDALGREVAVVTRGDLAAGRHELPVSTDGFASGLYIVRMRAGTFTRSQTLTVVQ